MVPWETPGEQILAMLPAPSLAPDVPHPGMTHGGMSGTPHLNLLPLTQWQGSHWAPWGAQADLGDPLAPDGVSQLHLVEAARSGGGPPGTPAPGRVKPTPVREGGQTWW